jgi:hypothetical protein
MRIILAFLFLLFFQGLSFGTNPDLTNWWTNISEGINDPQKAVTDEVQELIVDGNNVHVTWIVDDWMQQRELHYRKSSDGGLTWSNIINISELITEDVDYNALNTHLAVSGNYVHIALITSGPYGTEKLLYYRSTNGGSSFEPVRELFTISAWYLSDLRISGDGAHVNIGVIHSCSGCGGPTTPYIFHSSNNGESFTQKSLPSNYTGYDYATWDFKTVGANIHFMIFQPVGFWADYDSNLHFVSSFDQGNNFVDHTLSLPDSGGQGHPFNLNDYNWGYAPKFSVEGSNIAVTWSGWNELDQNTVFCAVSNDSGVTFNNTKKLVENITNYQRSLETTAINGDNIYVAYQTSNSKVYYLYSSNLGQTFEGPYELTNEDNKSVSATWGIRMIKDNRNQSILVTTAGPLMFELTNNGEIGRSSHIGNYSYSSRLPIIKQAQNGDIHIVHSSGNAWLSTGVFSDYDIFHRCLKNDINTLNSNNKTLSLTTIPNVGNGQGNERYDNMHIPVHESMNFTEAMTIEFQLKPDLDHNSERILTQFHRSTWSNGEAYGVQIWYDLYNKEQIVAGILTETGSYQVRSKIPIKAGYWHQISLVYENNGEPENFKLYINGHLDNSLTAVGKLITNHANWYLGSYEDLKEFKSDFDNLRLWEIPLSIHEIQENAFNGIDKTMSGLKCNIDFNTINEFGQVKDISGFNNHGLLMYKELIEDSTIERIDAKFSYTQENNTIYLTADTDEYEKITWNYGDGEYSELGNPSHTFTAFDNYNVCMTIYKDDNLGTHCEEITIRGVDHIFPEKSGNKGGLTLNIYGGGLPADGLISLQKEGQEDIVALKTTVDNNGDIAAVFDFQDIELGQWDVVISEGNTSLILEKSLSIVTSTGAQPWVSYTGGSSILKGRWTPQTLTVGNNGNNDAYGVLLWLAIPNNEDIEIEFVNANINKPQFAYDQGYDDELDEIPPYFEMDRFFDSPGERKVYPLYIKYLPANSTKNISLRVKTESLGKFQFDAFVSPPFYQSPLSTSVQACIAFAVAKAFIESGIDLIPGGSCVTGALGIVSKVVDDDPPPPSASENIDLEGWPWHLGSAVFDCAISLTPVQALRAIHIIGEVTINSASGFQEAENCKRGIWPEPYSIFQILYYGVSSFDPNEKYGPQGYGDMNYIAKTGQLNYKIGFENMEDATAPAQEVNIIDTLDVRNMNLDRFSFGPVSFGEHTIYPRAGQTHFTYDVDLRPEKLLIVRIQGSLDKVKGIVHWSFTSYDPETLELPFDPLGGFLPPNINSPQGEGYVSYTVGIGEDIKHNDQVYNSAVIIFDNNDPILTNNHLTTFDLLPPYGEVGNEMGFINNSTLVLDFDGQDNGSGIRHYELFVSENEADYNFYGLVTKDTIHFPTQLGSKYDMYVIAVDSVGNREMIPSMPELSVFVSSSENVLNLDCELYPNPANDALYLRIDPTFSMSLNIEIVDVLGRKIFELNDLNFPLSTSITDIPVSNLKSGIYYLKLKSQSKYKLLKFIKH